MHKKKKIILVITLLLGIIFTSTLLYFELNKNDISDIVKSEIKVETIKLTFAFRYKNMEINESSMDVGTGETVSFQNANYVLELTPNINKDHGESVEVNIRAYEKRKILNKLISAPNLVLLWNQPGTLEINENENSELKATVMVEKN